MTWSDQNLSLVREKRIIDIKIIFKKLQIKNINVYYKFSMYISRNPFLLSKSSFTFILLKNLSLLGIKKNNTYFLKISNSCTLLYTLPNISEKYITFYILEKKVSNSYTLSHTRWASLWKTRNNTSKKFFESLKFSHTVTYRLNKSLKNSRHSF